MEKMMTGYPSVDRPWLKYYSDEAIHAELPKCTIYEYLLKNNRGHESDTAIEYLGKKISYKELFEQIDKAASAFFSVGIKEGDIVPIMAVNMPEVVCSIYALNRIGAIPNMIDPRTGSEGLVKYITETNSKVLIALDLCYETVYKATQNVCLKQIILLSVSDSAFAPIKQIMKLKSRKIRVQESANMVTWKVFLQSAKEQIDDYPYCENNAAIIVHTGGTTGTPKGVILSNDNLNAVAHQVKFTCYGLVRRDKFLNILVPFVAYGIALGMHAPLSLGWDSILIPKFVPKDIVRLMKKHSPAAIMGIATYFEPLLKRKVDFRKCKAILMGGMPTKETFEIEMNKCIADGRGNFMVSKGYSMTEASSTATSSQNGANEIGSNGIPMVNTIVAAFDPDTGLEMPYDQLGELCISSPTQMIGYYNQLAETNNVLRKHSDGKTWIHSGDVGYVTKDGFVYVIDRIKRMIIRSGFKVFPSEIENVILRHEAVKSCAVISVEDKKDTWAPFAFIILEENINMNVKTIIEDLKKSILNNGLPSYFMPVGFAVKEIFPLTPAGKIDYRKLEKDTKLTQSE